MWWIGRDIEEIRRVVEEDGGGVRLLRVDGGENGGGGESPKKGDKGKGKASG